MAITHLLVAFSMVFLAMAIRASANGAGSYGYGPKPDLGKPKSAGSYGNGPKPDLGKPKSANGVGSYGYGSKPDLGKPKSANGVGSYGYGPKPDLGKPKSAGSYGYGPKPDLGKPKSANVVGSYGYGPKPELGKPKSDNDVGSYGYGPNPNVGKPKSEEKQLPTTIGVQGLVYCKLGSKLVPFQGVVTRITCLAVNDQGYESAPFSVLSHATDKNGYFFATLCPSELGNGWKLSECKAFLESSPLKICDVPTDFNKGISGALLLSHHLLPNKKMNSYSVGPFVYTSNPKSTTTGY